MKIEQQDVYITHCPQLKEGMLYQFECGPHKNTIFVMTDGELFLFSSKGISRHHDTDEGIDGQRYRVYPHQLILEN